jgi:fibronectin-binding autotransporter adhesin
MAQNYTRQSSFADGDTITAALFNNEFNQVVNAFSYSASSDSSTGHKHDGTAGQGGNIPQIGDIDFLNKIVVDNTNNRWGFYVQVSSGTVEQLRIQDGAIVPVTDDDIDLGTSSLEFKDLFLDGTAHIDTLDVDVNATVAGTLGVTGATTLSSTLGVTGATTLSSTLGVTGAITGSSTVQGTTITATTAFVPDASDGAALGTSALEFSDLFLADGAVINFGADQDVSLTHVADTGLLLNSTMALQFNDASQYINAPSATVLDINATDEIELNATLVDVNANLDVSGTVTATGTSVFASLDISGDIDVDGTTNLDVVDIDGAVNIAAATTIATDNKIQFRDTAIYVNSSTDGQLDIVADTEVQIAATTVDINGAVDISGNLDVGGNLVVTGTTTFNGGTLTLGDAASDNVVFGADVNSNIIPNTDSAFDLGSSTQEWRDLYLDGTAHIDTLDVDVNATIAGTLGVTGVLTGSSLDISGDIDIDGTANLDVVDIDGAVDMASTLTVAGVLTTTATQVATGGITSGSNIVSDTDSTDDLGTTSVRWANLFVDGITATDQITATGFTGTLDGILGSGAAAAATVTTLDTSGAVNLNLVTDSSSSTSGALIVDGGVGIAKKLYVGTDLDVEGTTNLDVVDIDGAVNMATTALVTGVLTTTAATVFNGGFASNADSTLGTDKKVQFRDSAIYINSSADGQLDIVADTEIQIAATTVDLNGNLDVSGTALVTGVLTTTAATVFNGGFASNADSTLGTDKKVQFRDSAIYINSSVDGQLDIVADTEIQIAATTIDVNGTLAFDSLKGTGATTVTNILDEDNMASDSATAIATQQSIKAYVDSQVGSFDTLAEVLAQGNTTGGTDLAVSTGDDITFADSSKAIFGAGSDLQIYHDGSNSYIKDDGTGDLIVSAANLQIIREDTAQQFIRCFAGDRVELYHAGNKKLGTTATGIDVTGSVTASGAVTMGSGNALKVQSGINAYIDSGTDAANANIFVTGAGAGDFASEAGHLVIQPRVQGTVYRDIIFASGITTADPILTLFGEGSATFSGNVTTGSQTIRRDTVTIGGISNSADDLTIFSTTAGHNGLRFHDVGLLPTDNTGALIDANCDIGIGTYRFKDLYLSGGVYLGGTGAANLLDDYEEGTFTPAFVITNCTVTHDLQQGNYTKVGNTVFFHMVIGTDAASGSFSGSNVLITGMPFAASRTQAGAVGLNHSWASELDDPSWSISSGTTTMAFYKADNAAGFVVGAQFATGGNSNRLDITGCYHTDS